MSKQESGFGQIEWYCTRRWIIGRGPPSLGQIKIFTQIICFFMSFKPICIWWLLWILTKGPNRRSICTKCYFATFTLGTCWFTKCVMNVKWYKTALQILLVVHQKCNKYLFLARMSWSRKCAQCTEHASSLSSRIIFSLLSLYIDPDKILYIDSDKILDIDPDKILYIDPDKILYIDPDKILYIDRDKILYIDPDKILYIDPDKILNIDRGHQVFGQLNIFSSHIRKRWSSILNLAMWSYSMNIVKFSMYGHMSHSARCSLWQLWGCTNQGWRPEYEYV